MSTFRLKWNGPEILRLQEAKTIAAIDATTEEAARLAVTGRWWEARSAEGLVSEVKTQPARKVRSTISGRFGTTQRRGFYGLFLEREQPFLRPAADEAFPNLYFRLAGKAPR
jgi:hypothetical protein